jgi:hypothetical protein
MCDFFQLQLTVLSWIKKYEDKGLHNNGYLICRKSNKITEYKEMENDRIPEIAWSYIPQTSRKPLIQLQGNYYAIFFLKTVYKWNK